MILTLNNKTFIKVHPSHGLWVRKHMTIRDHNIEFIKLCKINGASWVTKYSNRDIDGVIANIRKRLDDNDRIESVIINLSESQSTPKFSWNYC